MLTASFMFKKCVYEKILNVVAFDYCGVGFSSSK